MITLTGSVLMPNGQPPVSGTLTLTLLSNGSSGGDAVLGRKVYRIPTGGDLATASPAWTVVANEDISPTNTLYAAEWVLIDADGVSYTQQELWSFATTPTTLDVGDVTKIDTATFPSASAARWPVYTAATEPAATDEMRGRPYRVFDAGAPESARVVLRNSDSTFYVHTIGEGLY